MVTVNADKDLRKQLLALLKEAQAHATFDDAVADFPAAKRGAVPEGLPYSAWQLLEHLRIAQRDILEFSTNEDGHYEELKWPDGYWPEKAEPPSAKAWDESIAAIKEDLGEFEKLVEKGDLHTPFAWGQGQNLLREVLLVADHSAYHVGELIMLRRLLGIWR
ncbi:DinB family protein [Terriglobus albidus]|uniref:DinB family protein n=1 Tax=Terriglobus albidus TaxID=1592106 RepID=UPI0021E0C63C|nr:DinB family protein [Terriglobus albidus]